MMSNRPLIAIVDDDALVRQSIKRLVRSEGIDAETFASGCEFIDVLDEIPAFRPRCVILDMQMPGLNGLQVQEKLPLRRRGIPVIFITADPEIRKQALALGAVAFFQKPFDCDLFIETLRAVLEIKGCSNPCS
jgi:FixJ family two-component response regulator